ncbi:MAG: hypothetical protein JRJ20_12420 [Deltaproteobacteria bacterium]|nr:hypothetical protein [Deltaproteobacteria bacterium]
MKKNSVFLIAILLVLFSSGLAGAVSMQPDPVDLYDLSHGTYYIWGINWSIPPGETIVEASLSFDDIRNWKEEPNDLYVHLLDDPDVGTFSYCDTKSGNEFENQGVLLNHWEDLSNTAQDITYHFDADELIALNQYAADGNFGFGFDPDCHFYNDGITFTIETSAIPVPGAFFLLASGLICLVGVRRKFFV